MTNTNGGPEPINWSNDPDPITRAAQSIASVAERAFQLAYMLQIMRTQRVQDDLAALGASDAQVPTERARAEALNTTVEEGDVVLVPEHNRAARVVNVGTDGRITVTLGEHLDLHPGQYQDLRNPTTNPGRPDTGPQTKPDPEPDRPLQAGDRVRALDRGNIGEIISVDEDTAQVRFTNNQTGRSADVSLPTSGIERLPQQPPRASGHLRPDGRPDPERIQRARTNGRRPTRPTSWQQTQRRRPRRPPPKPPTTPT